MHKQYFVNYKTHREAEEPLLTINGRLQSGKLQGLVIIMGMFSNDPECLCSDVSVDGVGFIGYFNEGIPTGFGWKGLFGGIGKLIS